MTKKATDYKEFCEWRGREIDDYERRQENIERLFTLEELDLLYEADKEILWGLGNITQQQRDLIERRKELKKK